MRQADLGSAAGMSQVRIGELERGLGAGASLETWACAAAAVGERLVGFLELAPGATPPRDIKHLRRQAALIELARGAGWTALPEVAIDPGVVRSRSIDVVLLRAVRREAILCEIWDWFDDVGASLRPLDGKRDGLLSRIAQDLTGQPTWVIRCVFIVRRTRRNERLITELRPIFAARFAGSAQRWMRVLVEPEIDLPSADGLLWSTSSFSLQPSRLGRAG